jgi:hypothetical protein
MAGDLNISEAADDDRDAAQAAAYVAELAGDLAVIAKRHRLDTLGYILDMAKLEAETVTHHVSGRR